MEMNEEQEIPIGHAVEIIKCPLCDNLVTSHNQKILTHKMKINEEEFLAHVVYPLSDSSVFLCHECYLEFVYAVEALRSNLQQRVGRYNKKIIIKENNNE